MNRLTALWRMYKKNQKKISRVSSVILTVLILALIGYFGISIWLSDRAKANDVNGTQTEEESPLQADRDRDYGEPGLKQVAQAGSLILYADTTNGEIAVEETQSDIIWYSNPQDRAEDTVAPIKTRLDSQIIISYFLTSANNEETLDSMSGCVKLGGLDYELIDGGIKFLYSFPNVGIQIPVQYTISERGFAAEILMGEIQEYASDSYLLLQIDLLPYFGAGGLEDEGYLMVPDGSGALINFNNGKQRFAQYTASVYGSDSVVTSSTITPKTEQITMPVFGLKSNDHALFAIISSGEMYGRITAYTSKKLSIYNQVYSSVRYRDYICPDPSLRTGNNRVYYDEHTEPFTDGIYRVEYYMLGGEEANYSGMANFYRTWLLEQGRLNESELAQESWFVLNLYGAVSIEQYVMGIKKPVVTALTSYKDVIEIVSELKQRGIDRIILNYIGAMEGGLKAEILDEFNTEAALGSRKDFEEMKAYLEQEGVIFFIESDPVNLYRNGNGYRWQNDACISFYDETVDLYEYSLSKGTPEISTRWNLIKPPIVSRITEKFFASAADNGLAHYSAAALGSMLYSDYDEDAPVYREESLEIWEGILASAAKNFEYVMVETGNAYVFPYADIIRNVATGDSGYDMIDESIPFYQMVTGSNLVISAAALNLTVDYHYQYLKALETGSNLSYTWSAGDVLSLVGTEYDDLVSTSFDYWVDTAVRQYLESKELRELTAGKAITGHRKLAEDVYETTYEDEIRVYVNYSDSDYLYDGVLIAAKGYAAVSQERKG